MHILGVALCVYEEGQNHIPTNILLSRNLGESWLGLIEEFRWGDTATDVVIA